MPSQFGFETDAEADRKREAVFKVGCETAIRIDPSVRAVLEDLRLARPHAGTKVFGGVSSPPNPIHGGRSVEFGYWWLSQNTDPEYRTSFLIKVEFLGFIKPGSYGHRMIITSGPGLDVLCEPEAIAEVIRKETGLSEEFCNLA